jgi:hypothetical protein
MAERLAAKNRRLKKLRERLEEKDRELERLRAEVARRSTGAQTEGLRPENMVWIFGSGRTGSTWLSSMMGDLEGHTVWHEPLVGELFGHLYYVRGVGNHNSEHFILGRHKEIWLGSIRSVVLDGANGRFPQAAQGGILIVKEPNGSIGAPLLVQALPERQGSWTSKADRWRETGKPSTRADTDPTGFVEGRAKVYLQDMGKARDAYDAHEGRKVLVRYENPRADTFGTMRRLYSTLDIAVNEEELARVVEEHSWERIPEEKKGPGKFYKKADPGAGGRT